MRTIVFACGIALLCASRVAVADDNGHFVDRRGTTRPFAPEYGTWFKARRPDYLRAAGEALLLTGLGTAYYWLDPLSNATDWDDPTLGEKLSGEAVTFDNNLQSTNFILHPIAGATVYGFSRLSGLGVYASFGYGVASSLVWEYLLEWREMVSVNDLVFTSFGGVALGEFLFHMGEYASSAPWNTRFSNQLAAYTLGGPHKLHAGTQARYPTTDLPPDSLGFSSAYWHRFALGYGFGAMQNDDRRSANVHAINLGAELVAMPGFLRPGDFEIGFDEGNFTEGGIRLLLDEDGLAEADGRVAAVLVGYFSNQFGPSEGSAKMIGVSTELRYYDSWRLGRRDGFAFIHLPGPTVGLWARTDKIGVQARSSGSVDFAAIYPVAFEPWAARFGTAGLKSVLAKENYVYAFCGSTRNQVSASIGPFGLGGNADFALCRSIQGLDRTQALVSRDVPSTDLVLELGAFVSAPKLGPFELRLEADELRRRGSMGRVEAERVDRRISGALDYVF